MTFQNIQRRKKAVKKLKINRQVELSHTSITLRKLRFELLGNIRSKHKCVIHILVPTTSPMKHRLGDNFYKYYVIAYV